MDIPGTISLSKKVRDTFQTIKNKTGVPNNVLSRIAIMLAIRSGEPMAGVTREDAGGQTLPRDLLFGDHVQSYEILIRQHITDQGSDMPFGKAIAALIEIGTHKMAHCRSLEDIVELR